MRPRYVRELIDHPPSPRLGKGRIVSDVGVKRPSMGELRLEVGRVGVVDRPQRVLLHTVEHARRGDAYGEAAQHEALSTFSDRNASPTRATRSTANPSGVPERVVWRVDSDEGDGNVGFMRSPVRAIALPDFRDLALRVRALPRLAAEC